MNTSASAFVGEIPEHYDKGLGPNIFVDYAGRLVDECCAEAVANVIELAAGTGIVSGKLRDRLPKDASLLVTDLNGPMLEVAKKKLEEGDNLRFSVADAMDLPFEEARFDLMVCQFGVMFFPDKVASFREAARVIKPGGRYVFNVWSAMSENPFSQMAHEVARQFFPDDPPGFYKVPFHYGDPQLVKADLAEAGWGDIRYETIRLSKRIEAPETFAKALVFGNPLIDEIRSRGGVSSDDVAREMASALHRTFGPSEMTMPLSATTFVCRKTQA